jgi:hypothetical protein
VTAEWNKIDLLEQSRYQRIAIDHRHENGFCASVATQVEAGRTVTKDQARVLMKIATKNGWRIPSGASPSRRARTNP